MPEKKTMERAREDARQGKSPSTQAGEFVREEMDHIREGKHGARSAKQAIAIGLSKARQAGVDLPPRGQAKSPAKSKGPASSAPASPRRSRATTAALKREGHQAASHQSLSRNARATAKSRGAANLKRAAQKAVRTKGKAGLKRAARKAARSRAR